jgi:hypothetical protein
VLRRRRLLHDLQVAELLPDGDVRDQWMAKSEERAARLLWREGDGAGVESAAWAACVSGLFIICYGGFILLAGSGVVDVFSSPDKKLATQIGVSLILAGIALLILGASYLDWARKYVPGEPLPAVISFMQSRSKRSPRAESRGI